MRLIYYKQKKKEIIKSTSIIFINVWTNLANKIIGPLNGMNLLIKNHYIPKH